jgi:hypothetical protein
MDCPKAFRAHWTGLRKAAHEATKAGHLSLALAASSKGMKNPQLNNAEKDRLLKRVTG